MHLSFHIGFMHIPEQTENSICHFCSPSTYLLKGGEIKQCIEWCSGHSYSPAWSVFSLLPSLPPPPATGKKGFDYNPWLQGLDWLLKPRGQLLCSFKSHRWPFQWQTAQTERQKEEERVIKKGRVKNVANTYEGFHCDAVKSTVNTICNCRMHSVVGVQPRALKHKPCACSPWRTLKKNNTLQANVAFQPIIRAKHTLLIKQIYSALIWEEHHDSTENLHQKVRWNAFHSVRPKWWQMISLLSTH